MYTRCLREMNSAKSREQSRQQIVNIRKFLGVLAEIEIIQTRSLSIETMFRAFEQSRLTLKVAGTLSRLNKNRI